MLHFNSKLAYAEFMETFLHIDFMIAEMIIMKYIHLYFLICGSPSSQNKTSALTEYTMEESDDWLKKWFIHSIFHFFR